jgi:hypothetical protein
VTTEAKLTLLFGLSTWLIGRMRGMRLVEVWVSILAGWFTRDAYSPIIDLLAGHGNPISAGRLMSGNAVYLSALFGLGAYTVGHMRGLRPFELWITILFGWYAYGTAGTLVMSVLGPMSRVGRWLTS